MLEFLLILGVKIIELTLDTIKTVFITRGKKLFSSAIGFVEILIWLKVIAMVLPTLNDSYSKMLAYALGYAAGIYIGILIESKMALGNSKLHVVVDKELGHPLAKQLRKQHVGVTLLKGEGKESQKDILVIYAKRKDQDNLIDLIQTYQENALITISEIKILHGGFGLNQKEP